MVNELTSKDLTQHMFMLRVNKLKENPIIQGIKADMNTLLIISHRPNKAMQEKFKEISLRFYDFVKNKGFDRVTKTLIEGLLFNNTFDNYGRFSILSSKERQQEYKKIDMRKARFKARMLKFLTESEKLIKSENAISVYSIRNKPLISDDKQSYKALMSINGYKRNAFIYDGIKKVYLKRYMDIDDYDTLDKTPIPEKYVKLDWENFDLIIPEVYTEIDSNKPDYEQGCLSLNQCSIIISKKSTIKKQYLIN